MALPLGIVVVVSMMKDAFEDYSRYKNDQQENFLQTNELDFNTSEFKKVNWKDIAVGSVLKIEQDQPIPADLLILSTSDLKGICYVETKNLDGETNLKIKNAESSLQQHFYKLDQFKTNF